MIKMKRLFVLLAIVCLVCFVQVLPAADSFVSNLAESFVWIKDGKSCPILVDKADDEGVLRAVRALQTDAFAVTGVKPRISTRLSGNRAVIIGSIEESKFIQKLLESGKLDDKSLRGKREKYIIQTIKKPLSGLEEAVVIAGSDKRGTIYGIYELSAQMGVSPWYYWADVPIQKQQIISIKDGIYTDGEPAVKYRGIFLNDEWPALTGWANEKFGGYNSRFYEKVFELVLRLKGNFMWPAMWNSAFYDDDAQNGILADEMGIIMGTSHHEPMALAQQDWKRRGSGKWNYRENAKVLQDFWKTGIERSKDWETVVTVGMRGDGDDPMDDHGNIAVLQKIIDDQREIIADVTKKPAQETPQVWALYKEVQEYYDNGMRVPDDITLLLCDDNWGNVRKLPSLSEPARKGGYGMYYHFDYVGGPRSYRWINVSQIQRIWEQMKLTYEFGVRELWIVNVGDLKPMEYPIQFWFDLAWNPDAYNADNLFEHTEKFARQCFGTKYDEEIANLIDDYGKFAHRRTPELMDENTYSIDNYNEFETVVAEMKNAETEALRLFVQLPQEYRDAYEQLVLFPLQALTNIYEMYYAVAMNHKKDERQNFWAQEAERLFIRDSVLNAHYNHEIGNGKWNHFMDQPHIGYTIWDMPKHNIMPVVYRAEESIPSTNVYAEADGYVSIEAEHFARKHDNATAKITVVPNSGKTLSSVTVTPFGFEPQPDKSNSVEVEYDINFISTGDFDVTLLLSPTLRYNNSGLRYAISFDGGDEQIVNYNNFKTFSLKYDTYEMDEGQKLAVNKSTTKHKIESVGLHTLKIRFIDSGTVLQKILIDTGGLRPSFLGAPESAKVQ